jgi:hypothetical protein
MSRFEWCLVEAFKLAILAACIAALVEWVW